MDDKAGSFGCGPTRETLSADLDGEANAEDCHLADVHLGRCSSCQAWWSSVGRVHRRLRVRRVEPVPDLAARVLERSHPPTIGRWRWRRWALLAVTLVELVTSVPSLLDGAGTGHDGRHVGAFGVAITVGMLYVALRPERAFGVLPVVAALAVSMTISAVVDVTKGNATGVAEMHHALEITSLVLVWQLAGRPLPRRRRRPSGAAL